MSDSETTSTPGSAHVDAVAQVYAKSLFELAEAEGGLPTVETTQYELQEIVEMARRDRMFDEFLRSRIVGAEEKEKTLRRIFGDGRVSDLALRFLLVANRKDRLGHLEDIANAYTRLWWDRTNRVEVEVFTAEPLDEGQAEQIRARVGQTLGKEPILRNTIDPEMIGGLKLRIGDRMIDASVATRLSRIRETLTTSGGNAIRGRLNALIA